MWANPQIEDGSGLTGHHLMKGFCTSLYKFHSAYFPIIIYAENCWASLCTYNTKQQGIRLDSNQSTGFSSLFGVPWLSVFDGSFQIHCSITTQMCQNL